MIRGVLNISIVSAAVWATWSSDWRCCEKHADSFGPKWCFLARTHAHTHTHTLGQHTITHAGGGFPTGKEWFHVLTASIYSSSCCSCFSPFSVHIWTSLFLSFSVRLHPSSPFFHPLPLPDRCCCPSVQAHPGQNEKTPSFRWCWRQRETAVVMWRIFKYNWNKLIKSNVDNPLIISVVNHATMTNICRLPVS